jgi:putative ABC transport system permease protein
VVVIGYGLWTRAFGRDPSAIGRTLALDREPFTIVGVMGDAFEFPPRGGEINNEPGRSTSRFAFSPFQRQGFGSQYNNGVVARLKPGVTVAQARAELVAIVKPLAERYPPVLAKMAAELSIPMWPFIDEVVGQSRRMIVVLMGAGRDRAAHRLRRRRQPDADPRRLPSAGAGRPFGARRQPGARRAAAPHGRVSSSRS